MSGSHAHEDLSARIAALEAAVAAIPPCPPDVTADIANIITRLDALEAEQPPAIVPPGPTNTGAHGPLTPHTGDITVRTPGTLIEGLDITGRIRVKAADVTIRNCVIRGGGTPATLIEAWDTACARLLVEDCTLAADTPGINSNGIHGHGYTSRRCDISRVVDGCGAFNAGIPADVVIEDTWIHDLHCQPDPARSDGITHNDCIQIHGEGGVTIRRNTLTANPGPTSTGGVGGMACVMLTPGRSPAPDVVIEDNHLDYGTACLNLNANSATDTVSSATVRRNTFGRHGARDDAPTGFRILALRALTCPGLPARSGPDTAGNVFLDDGTPVPVVRA